MEWQRCPELDERTPLSLMAAWPRSTPLAMLHTNPADVSGRWSVLGVPSGHIEANATSGTWRGPDDLELQKAASLGALAAIDAIDARRMTATLHAETPPFAGWIACLHYELGEVLEPAVRRDAGQDTTALVTLLWCPDALLHDRLTGQWWSAGNPPTPASTSLLGEEMSVLGPFVSTPPSADWPAAVARGVEYIKAGDIFQVNLTRRLQVDVCGDGRHFGHAALSEPQTAYGAYIEIPDTDRTIISLSPELFISVDACGTIMSQPIKGTLPAAEPAAGLWESAKDAAELHMIVDLMRNDLGRVCEMGSVKVPCPRRIETHPTVHHGVGEIVGTLRQDISLVELLAATFPAGSITGAPKIRAMQIARELEPVSRGLYCGAVGMLGPGQQATFSVAIRTAVIEDGTLTYGVGCGIVADSDPLVELAESETKADVLRRTLSRPCGTPSVAAAGPRSLA
ncbi:MAG: anthranilate synthase component I family protein [Phycisphaerales bacterium]|nr:anthranilate synthase component I family protein [Phycisphaerales bacterium]